MNLVKKVGKSFLRKMLKAEFEAQTYEPNERCVEYRFVFEAITRLAPQTILDVGTGKTALPHLMQTCGVKVTATDNIFDYWSKFGMFNRHFYVIDDDITKSKMDSTFDLITCISTLEHIVRFDDAMANMARLLNPNGHLILTCPFTANHYVDNVYQLPGSCVDPNVGYICQSFAQKNLDQWLKVTGLTVVQQEYWQCYKGKAWSVGEAVHPPKKVGPTELHQLTCLLLKR